MPQINSLAATYRERGLVVIAVNIYESASIVRNYQNQNPNILFLLDTNGSVWNKYYQNGYIPLNYTIGHDLSQSVDYWMEGYSGSTIQSRLNNLYSDVSLIMTPDSATYHQGGTLGFDIDMKNYSPAPRTFYALVDVELPSSSYFALFPPVSLTLGGNQTKHVRINYPLPPAVPLGNYVMRARIGWPADLWNADTFDFEIVP